MTVLAQRYLRHLRLRFSAAPRLRVKPPSDKAEG
jgi:hypothetical protein